MPSEPDRRSVLQDLISLTVPVDQANGRVRALPWDSSTAFVLLNRADCVRLLDSYLTERLTAEQCETWAEAIESREDVELEDGASDLLKAFLFEISTPEINGPLSLESAREWKDRLA